MKSVLKIMKQPPRVVPPKTAVHTTNNKKDKILENTHKGPHLHQNGRYLEMNPLQEFSKYT